MVVLIGLAVVFVGLLALQLPRMMKSSDTSSTAPVAGSTVQPAVSGSTGTLASSSLTVGASSARTRAIRRLDAKDPFVPLIRDNAGSASTAPAAPAASRPRARRSVRPAAPARIHRTRPAARPRVIKPAAPTAAVIWTNGNPQTVGIGQAFKVGDTTFRVVGVTRKAMRLRAVGGAFAGGKRTITVRKGHPIKLVNTATGVTYSVRFTAGTTAAPTVAQPGSQPTQPTLPNAAPSAGSCNQEPMNPIHRKACSVEMTNTNDHRDVPRGLSRRVRRPRLLIYAAVVAVVATVPVANGSAARGPALAKPTGLQTFQAPPGRALAALRAKADGVLRGRRPSHGLRLSGRNPLRVRAFDEQVFTRGKRVVWSSKSAHHARGGRADIAALVTGRLRLSTGVCAQRTDGVSAWSNPNRFRWVGNDVQDRRAFRTSCRASPASFVGAEWRARRVIRSGSPMSATPRIVSTITTVADDREYYGAHAPGSRVEWRVRALRRSTGLTKNGLPGLLYGTWSGTYVSQLPDSPQPAAHPVPRFAVSDVTSSGKTPPRTNSCPRLSFRRATARAAPCLHGD